VVRYQRRLVAYDHGRRGGKRQRNRVLLGGGQHQFDPAFRITQHRGSHLHRYAERRLHLLDYAERVVCVGRRHDGFCGRRRDGRLCVDGIELGVVDHHYLGRERQRSWIGGLLGRGEHQRESPNWNDDGCRAHVHGYAGRGGLHVRTLAGQRHARCGGGVRSCLGHGRHRLRLDRIEQRVVDHGREWGQRQRKRTGQLHRRSEPRNIVASRDNNNWGANVHRDAGRADLHVHRFASQHVGACRGHERKPQR
jgi:hypothetical protein